MSYVEPGEEFERELIVKKSRFIARIVPVKTREYALAAVERARKDYPDARHHCWAYLLGRPTDAVGAGMNDDGEPAGTAGKPILNVLQHGEIGDACVIVIRYFGGIKLGAGGLVRAYSAATQAVADSVPTRPVLHFEQWGASGDFSAEQRIRHWLSNHNGSIEQVQYTHRLFAVVKLPATESTDFRAFCAANQISLHSDPASTEILPESPVTPQG